MAWFGAQGVRAHLDRVGDGRRFGDWDAKGTPLSVATEIADFLTAKGFVVITRERFKFICSIPNWVRFVDPFISPSDLKSIVIREEGAETFRIRLNAQELWVVEAVELEDISQGDGWISELEECYETYLTNIKNSERAMSMQEFTKSWLLVGSTNLKTWWPWMSVAGSVREAQSWMELSLDPDSARESLLKGVGLTRLKSLQEEELLRIKSAAEDQKNQKIERVREFKARCSEVCQILSQEEKSVSEVRRAVWTLLTPVSEVSLPIEDSIERFWELGRKTKQTIGLLSLNEVEELVLSLGIAHEFAPDFQVARCIEDGTLFELVERLGKEK